MKPYIIPSILIISIGIFSSCQKDKVADPMPEPEKPKATFVTHSPDDSSNYGFGDTVFLKIDIKAEVPLHGYELEILSLPDSSRLFASHGHAHGKAIELDTFWVNTLKASSSGLILLEAPLDHEGNIGRKQIPITLNKP